MAFLYPQHLIPITLSELAVITAADGKDVRTVPFDAKVFLVHMKLGTIGSGSGNNDAVVAYTKPTGGISTSGDLWTVASGVGRIAFDAAAKYLSWDVDSLDYSIIERGGTLSLDVDAVAAAGSPADLEITLWVAPLNRQ